MLQTYCSNGELYSLLQSYSLSPGWSHSLLFVCELKRLHLKSEKPKQT